MLGGVVVGSIGCAPPSTRPGCDVPTLGGITGEGTVVSVEVGKVVAVCELLTDEELLSG
jgi:hypothetical protein